MTARSVPVAAHDPIGFVPDRARTRAIERAMRRRLVESVEAVIGTARRLEIPIPGDVAAWGSRTQACDRVPPRVWACYHDLVQAGMREDLAAVERLAVELLSWDGSDATHAPGAPGRVVTVAPRDLGADAARYIRLIDSDPERPLGLMPVAPAETARIAALLVEARALLAETAPALLDEIDTLAHQIVLATSGSPRGFGGAATVFLWGAVILNPTLVANRVALVEALAHESAHALLFGLTLGADLTSNGPDERYASPLRPDPRPIEGIVHATFVLARMTFALERLPGSARLTPTEHALIETRLARTRANYAAGLGTVDAHARFTEAGASIFAACRQAMADNHQPTHGAPAATPLPPR